MNYTYLIGWSSLDKWYYGCRYSKFSDPSDLWSEYFTSSDTVTEFRRVNGEPDIIKVHKIFETADLTLDYEKRFLNKVKAAQSSRWLNKSNGHNKIYLSEFTLEHRLRISSALKGIVRSSETCKRISKAKLGKSVFSDNAKALKSAQMTGENNPMFGATHTNESRAKIGEASKGNIRRLGLKSTDETKRRVSENHANVSGQNNPMFGRKHSQETITKMKAAKSRA